MGVHLTCSESISDDDLIRGFILALGADGRKPKTLGNYEDSIRALSEFARNLGLDCLAAMDLTPICDRLRSTKLVIRLSRPVDSSVGCFVEVDVIVEC